MYSANSVLYSERIADFLGRIGLVILVFLATCSKLISLPLDKVAMVALIGLLLFHQLWTGKSAPNKLVLPILVATGFILTTFLLNMPGSSLIIFFPVIGLFFAGLLSREISFLNIIYWALFIHVVIGIFFVFSSYLVGINSFVHPMYDKGLPFLHAAKGFTTTVQSFGTLLISWFLIYYWKKEANLLSGVDRLAYRMVLLGLILTFNRNTFLIFYLIVMFKHPRIFVATILAALLLYAYYFEFINKLIFNVSTISSRADLLQAFRISFFEMSGWKDYLIGHGNNMVHETIAKKTIYKTGYIENGTSVLLYTYGFMGYIAYLVSVLALSVILWLRSKVFYAALFFYIFLIAQQFTHEFYATTLYIMVGIFFIITNYSTPFETKGRILSSAE